MRANIADDLDIKTQNAPARIKSHTRMGDTVATLIITQETFIAITGPFHRTAEDARSP